MARRYTRDNRGRFASVGATARGGRLKTASGTSRATQTAKISGGSPGGTIGKPRGLKPGAIKSKPQAMTPQQVRDTREQKIKLERQASAVSSRMGHTNAAPSDQARLHKEAQQLRSKADALGKQLKGQQEPPHIYARGRGLTGESTGKYKGQGRFSLYGKDRGVIGRGRLSSTVRKPGGLQPGALTPKPPVKPVTKPKITKAEKAVAAAQKRLQTKRYGDTASQGQALLIDRRIASMTPRQYAGAQVRSTSALVRRTQKGIRQNADAPQQWKDSMARRLTDLRKQFRAAASDYRVLVPKPRRK